MQLIALIDPGWKFIYRAQAGRARLKQVELYDRRADPGDQNDLASQWQDLAGKFQSQVADWIDVQKQVRKQLGPGGTSKMDPQTLERLRSLGYVGGGRK